MGGAPNATLGALDAPNATLGALDAPNATFGALDAPNATLGRLGGDRNCRCLPVAWKTGGAPTREGQASGAAYFSRSRASTSASVSGAGSSSARAFSRLSDRRTAHTTTSRPSAYSG
jgi:hypothetical protein